ncbi:PREDICTED: protein phosphatase 2C-like domain-containing protein 1 isoform X1 [Branchiostoma belcheri]|uniref:Protein phosphatase 2C-like domain-containing protein 1 isoform X1 n=2 Tax=Branchiostoma belcheri TaxID=7741 RepID=A0A6P4YHM1_BRABE|nr:PREDICTED: protein phosphatase 2C-like domain-containing protein 1 isoform X1 [Branchiostoma belcheri]
MEDGAESWRESSASASEVYSDSASEFSDDGSSMIKPQLVHSDSEQSSNSDQEELQGPSTTGRRTTRYTGTRKGRGDGAKSPETLITDYPIKPDITIQCEQCRNFMDIRDFNEHRAFHKALKMYGYQGVTEPNSLEELIERRKRLLKRLTSEATPEKPIPQDKLRKINDAYELLKSDLEGTYEVFRQVREDIQVDIEGIALNCSAQCARAVGICADANPRWRTSMEDFGVFQNHFGEDPNKTFFALYDGHHGPFAAEVASDELHRYLIEEVAKFDSDVVYDRPEDLQHPEDYLNLKDKDETAVTYRSVNQDGETARSTKAGEATVPGDPYTEDIATAFRRAHQQTDWVLTRGRDEQSRVRWSGCSTLTCLVQNANMEDVSDDETDEAKTARTNPSSVEKDLPQEKGVLFVANAGNTHAVLCRDGKTYRITMDHTTSNPHERSRVVRTGGTITGSKKHGRIFGTMATTRGLGNHGDVNIKKCVLNEPFTTCVSIDQYAQFLILASNGVWEVLSDKEAVSLLLQMVPGQEIPPPSDQPPISIHGGSRWNGQSSFAGSNKPMIGDNHALNRGGGKTDRSQRGGARAQTALSVKLHTPRDVDKTAEKGNEGKKDDKKDEKERAKLEEKLDIVSKSLEQGQNQEKFDDEEVEVGSVISENIKILEADFGDQKSEVESQKPIQNYPAIYTQSELTCMPTKREMYCNLAKLMAERLVQSALLAGSKDNITVMVVLLPGCKI